MKKNKKQWLVFILSDIQDVQNRLDYLAVTLNRELQTITEDGDDEKPVKSVLKKQLNNMPNQNNP